MHPSINCKSTLLVLATLCFQLSGCGDSAPEALVASAKQHIDRQDSQSALIILKKLVREQPEQAEAQQLLGELYFRLGNFSLASRTLKRAVALNENNHNLFLHYIESLIEQKAYETAMETIASKHVPQQILGATTALSAISLIGLNKVDAATAALNNIKAPDQNHHLVLYAKSLLHQAKKEHNLSVKYASQATVGAPNNPILHRHLGTLLFTRQLYQDAVKEFEASLIATGESRITAQNLSTKLIILQSFLADENLPQAEAALAELKSAASDHPATSYFSGLTALQQRNFKKAQEEAEATLGIAPNHSPAQLLAGLASYQLQNYELANMYLERFLAKQPDHQTARKKLAATLLHLDKPRDAEVEFKKIAGTAADNAELQAILGSLEQSLSHRRPNRTALEDLLQRLDAIDDQATSAVTTVRRLLSRGRYIETDRQLSKLLDELPDDIQYLNLAGASAALQNKTEEAEKLFRRALALDPTALDTTLNLGLVLAANNQYDAATDLFKELLTERPNSTQLMLELAKLADRQQHKEEALAWVNQAIDTDPKATKPWRILLNYHLRAGEHQLAKEAALKAQQLLPEQPLIKLLLAQAQAGLGKPKLAVDILAGLVQTSPDNGAYHLQLARYQLAASRKQPALESFRKANALLPGEYALTGQLAVMEWITGNHETALALVDEYIAEQPDDPRGYGLQANLLARADNQSGAAKALGRAAELKPTREWTMRYVHALLVDAQNDDAFNTAEAWLKENPTEHSFRNQLVNLYLTQGNTERAIQHSNRLSDQGIENSDTLNNIAWTLYKDNQPQALTYAERAVAADSLNVNAIDTLAWILIDSGSNPQRGTTLLASLKDLPTSLYPTAQYHLAVGLKRLGNHLEAAAILSKITTNRYQFANKPAAIKLLKKLTDAGQ